MATKTEKKEVKNEGAKVAQNGFVIQAEQLNEIANYLANRPYIEVAKLINTISSLPKVGE